MCTPTLAMSNVGGSGDALQFTSGGHVKPSDIGLEDGVVLALSRRLGIESLFTMQAKVVSHILSSAGQDVVLCAPTGSGKTLAYALPIVSSLSKRVVPRLRTVVIVPTRDLAVQVHGVFSALCTDLGIHVAMSVGASSVQRETANVCSAEILIATPGRLLEHTKNTVGFTLRYVQYLVLDESDRLLEDSFYGWADVVIPACGRKPNASDGSVPTGLAAVALHPLSANFATRPGQCTRRRPRVILASATQTRNPKRLALLDLQQPKLFVRAHQVDVKEEDELGDDADPDSERYTVPETLVERAYVVSRPQEKLIALVKLLALAQRRLSHVAEKESKMETLERTGSMLIFTKSVEAAHRLARFLELSVERSGADITVVEISSGLSAERRRHLFTSMLGTRRDVEVRNDKADVSDSTSMQCNCIIAVCSDMLARGMDIGSVDVVINYDVPVHANTYLHRVGRTARAGRTGLSITLLLAKQARHFKAVVRSIDRGSAKFHLRTLVGHDESFDYILPQVDGTLNALKRVLRREQLGLINSGIKLPLYTLRELTSRVSAHEIRITEFDDDITNKAVTNTEGNETSDEHASVQKRCRTMLNDSAMDDRRLNTDDHALIEVGELDPNYATHLDDVTQGSDDFSVLIRSQVARNFLFPKT